MPQYQPYTKSVESTGWRKEICKYCNEQIMPTEAWSTSRRRGVTKYNPTYKKEYWHVACANGIPRWKQHELNGTTTVNPTESFQPQTQTNEPSTQIASESLVAQVLAAVDRKLIPQIESWASEQETKQAEYGKALGDTLEEALNERLAAIRKEFEAQRPTVMNVTLPSGVTHTVQIGLKHNQFDTLLELISALDPKDRNIWIAGPVGSGKTTAAEQVAKVLNVGYYFSGKISDSSQLLGFVDGNGHYHTTAFREAFEKGGVYLQDEYDASDANEVLPLNSATANATMTFPDSPTPISRHENNVIIACTNTWGHGADAKHVGRNQMDASTLDRYIALPWDYDEVLERAIVITKYPSKYAEEWVTVVQTVRAKAIATGAKYVISPRASEKGAQLLARGLSKKLTVKAIFGKYSADTKAAAFWPTVGEAAEAFASSPFNPL